MNTKEYNAEYYRKHRKEISEQRKQHYQEYKECIRARNRKWLENNREQWNAYMRNRRKKEEQNDS